MTKLFVGYTLEWFEKEKIQMEPEEWEDGSRVDNTLADLNGGILMLILKMVR